jgi:hypothetical protein
MPTIRWVTLRSLNKSSTSKKEKRTDSYVGPFFMHAIVIKKPAPSGPVLIQAEKNGLLINQ